MCSSTECPPEGGRSPSYELGGSNRNAWRHARVRTHDCGAGHLSLWVLGKPTLRSYGRSYIESLVCGVFAEGRGGQALETCCARSMAEGRWPRQGFKFRGRKGRRPSAKRAPCSDPQVPSCRGISGGKPPRSPSMVARRQPAFLLPVLAGRRPPPAASPEPSLSGQLSGPGGHGARHKPPSR